MEAKANNIWEEEQEKSNAAANQSQFQRLLSIGQVAEILGVSVRMVWRLVAAKELCQPVRIGRACRWFKSDIVAYLKRLEAERKGEVKRLRRRIQYVLKPENQAEYRGRYRLPCQDRLTEVLLNTRDRQTANMMLTGIVEKVEEELCGKAA